MPGTVISLRDTSSSRGAQSVRRSLEHCRQHCHRVDRDVAGLGLMAALCYVVVRLFSR
jgi:hypothetical protein